MDIESFSKVFSTFNFVFLYIILLISITNFISFQKEKKKLFKSSIIA